MWSGWVSGASATGRLLHHPGRQQSAHAAGELLPILARGPGAGGRWEDFKEILSSFFWFYLISEWKSETQKSINGVLASIWNDLEGHGRLWKAMQCRFCPDLLVRTWLIFQHSHDIPRRVPVFDDMFPAGSGCRVFECLCFWFLWLHLIDCGPWWPKGNDSGKELCAYKAATLQEALFVSWWFSMWIVPSLT